MIIPASILEPFGVIGWPKRQTDAARVHDIKDAIHDLISNPHLGHLSPVMMGVLLRNMAIKAGAHSVKSPRKTLSHGTVFDVTFTLEPNGRRYHTFPAYHKK